MLIKLELNRGAGLAPLVPLLARPRDAYVVALVRDTLLGLLVARVQGAAPRVIVVDPRRRRQAWTEITSLVFG
jgi:hypothetical protein